MSYYVKFRSKTKIDGLDALCCWCYEISADEEDTFRQGERWGLSFPRTVDIQHPENYAEFNDYLLDSFHKVGELTGNWVVYTELSAETTKFTLSFIAPSKEDKDTPITLRKDVPGERPWDTAVSFQGRSRIIGPSTS